MRVVAVRRALRAARDDPRLRRRAAPRRAARWTPTGTPTPTTSSRSRASGRGHPDDGQLEAVRRARGDNANTHAAIHWLTACARAGDRRALEKGLLLCGHLNWFWHIGGQHLTARVRLDALLALAADAAAEPRPRARAGSGPAWSRRPPASGSGRSASGPAAYEDGLAVGDERIAAEGRMGVGYCNLSLGRIDAAAARRSTRRLGRSAGGGRATSSRRSR